MARSHYVRSEETGVLQNNRKTDRTGRPEWAESFWRAGRPFRLRRTDLSSLGEGKMYNNVYHPCSRGSRFPSIEVPAMLRQGL